MGLDLDRRKFISRHDYQILKIGTSAGVCYCANSICRVILVLQPTSPPSARLGDSLVEHYDKQRYLHVWVAGQRVKELRYGNVGMADSATAVGTGLVSADVRTCPPMVHRSHSG